MLPLDHPTRITPPTLAGHGTIDPRPASTQVPVDTTVEGACTTHPHTACTLMQALPGRTTPTPIAPVHLGE